MGKEANGELDLCFLSPHLFVNFTVWCRHTMAILSTQRAVCGIKSVTIFWCWLLVLKWNNVCKELIFSFTLKAFTYILGEKCRNWWKCVEWTHGGLQRKFPHRYSAKCKFVAPLFPTTVTCPIRNMQSAHHDLAALLSVTRGRCCFFFAKMTRYQHFYRPAQ